MDGEDLGLIEDEGGTELDQGDQEGAGSEEETETEEPETEGGQESESEEGGEDGGADEGGGKRTSADNKSFNEFRKVFRDFLTKNPDLAKQYPKLERQLPAMWWKAAQLDSLGGLKDLRAAKEVLESHGGLEGIREMAEDVEAMRMIEKGFEEGDTDVVDTWAVQYPEGLKKLLGHAIAKVEQLDLAAHDRALSMPMLRALDRCGVLSTISELQTALAGERWEDIQKHAGALKQFVEELKTFADRARKGPAADPLKADREQFEQEKETDRTQRFFGGVQAAVNQQTQTWMNKLLRQELAGRKLQQRTANRLREQIHSDLAKAVNLAPGYKEQRDAVFAKRDERASAAFVLTSVRQKLPGIVRAVLRDFNLGKPAGVGRRPAGGTFRKAGSLDREGPVTVNGRPKTSDVDFSKTDKARWLTMQQHGEVWLKNGKQAKW